MYIQSTNGSRRESVVTSLNNSLWPLVCDTTEHVHVLPVTAIPGPTAQCLCPLPASFPISPLRTALAMSLQQLGRVQSLPSSWEAEKPGSKARRAGFQCRETWPRLLAMESGRRMPQQQDLGQGLRRTGVRRKLCTPPLLTGVWLTLAVLFLFYQQRHQSCFILQEALREKNLRKTSYLLLCHVVKVVQNTQMRFWKPTLKTQPKYCTFFGKSCVACPSSLGCHWASEPVSQLTQDKATRYDPKGGILH